MKETVNDLHSGLQNIGTQTEKKLPFILKIIFFMSVLCLIIAAIHILEGFTRGRTVKYIETEYYSEKVPKELDGYVLAFVSDPHFISLKQLKDVSEKISERDVGLLAIGGDFPENETQANERSEILGTISTRHGIYGVQGNHDGNNNIFDCYSNNGIIPLENIGVHIDGLPLFISGVGDHWMKNVDIQEATKNLRNDEFSLMICHNPDVSMEYDCTNVDLMLSGHTHGGQATLFGIWKPLLKGVTKHGYLFQGSWAEANDADVYVTVGMGQSKTYPRIFAQPEVVYITLRAI